MIGTRFTPPALRRPVRGIWLIVALTAGTAAAQTPNPRRVEFNASPDHAVTLSDGGPAVVRYALELYMVGAPAPFHSVDLGKPAPGVDNVVRYDFGSQMASWPLPGGTYEARIAAIGPYGSESSMASNTFTFGAGCAVKLSATDAEANWPGGTLSVMISEAAACTWTASSPVAWITVSRSTGTGTGPFTYSVLPNEGWRPRSATVTIGTASLVVLQTEKPSSFPLSPQNLRVLPTP
jgi:hypothetical protein